MDEKAEDDLQKLYLRAARIDGHARAFTIGPFGSRVSFASQQRRALNTIWALERAQMISPGSRVAVVGGGLAGLMAATALTARKCSVHLYEKEGRVLSRQRLTYHRYVHPTINFWPEMAFYPTTRFPFLDWHADRCANIIQRLFVEWKEYFRPLLSSVNLGTRVVTITSSNSVARLQGEGPNGSFSKEFDLVLFCVGFGDEKTVTGIASPSYWEEDTLSDAEGEGSVPLVSGVGDGGVIDALRAVHKDFGAGELCERIVPMLNSSGTTAAIAKLERTITAQGDLTPELAAASYEVGYREALSDTPIMIRSLLYESLKESIATPVILLGRLPSPYSLTSAPIHKLMLAHAISEKAITYQQGEIEAGPSILSSGYSNPVPLGTLVRHGPDTNFDHILDSGAAAAIRSRQMVMADIIDAAPYDGRYWAGLLRYPAQDFSSETFVRFRYPSACNYVAGHLGVPLAIRAEAPAIPHYFIEQDPSRVDLESQVPDRLFGVATELRPSTVLNVRH